MQSDSPETPSAHSNILHNENGYKHNSSVSATELIASKKIAARRNISSVAKVLGLDRKTLRKNAKNPNRNRKARSDKINDRTCESIQNVYQEEVSRQMPNKRDVILIKDSTGKKNSPFRSV